MTNSFLLSISKLLALLTLTKICFKKCLSIKTMFLLLHNIRYVSFWNITWNNSLVELVNALIHHDYFLDC